MDKGRPRTKSQRLYATGKITADLNGEKIFDQINDTSHHKVKLEIRGWVQKKDIKEIKTYQPRAKFKNGKMVKVK